MLTIRKVVMISLAVAGVMLIATSSAYALSIPGITESGAPNFVNSVKVRTGNGKWTITGRKDFLFDDGSTVWMGDASTYKVNVVFDDVGMFVSGSVSLKGKIDALGIPRNTILMTADLTSFGFDPMQPNLVGFNTTNIFCDAGLGINCTLSESIYIQLDTAFVGDVNARFRTSGIALTTVPLPAAAWLFGSGLMGLAAIRRRKLRAAA